MLLNVPVSLETNQDKWIKLTENKAVSCFVVFHTLDGDKYTAKYREISFSEVEGILFGGKKEAGAGGS